MITIYHRARDWPQFDFVAREWFITPGRTSPAPGLFAIGNTLDQVRAAIPISMCRLPRVPGDDPVIVETWI